MEDVVNLAFNTPPRSTYSISVVIPMYNVEEFITECLDSLLIQTFQDFEVIIVDDCSTDGSLDIAKNYAEKFDGRFTIAQTEKISGSEGPPRNIGFELSKGEYIFFMDSDDFILGSALETLYNTAKKYNADVVYPVAITPYEKRMMFIFIKTGLVENYLKKIWKTKQS